MTSRESAPSALGDLAGGKASRGGMPIGAVARFVRAKPLGAFGLLVILAILLTAVFAGSLATRDPSRTDPIHRLQAPSARNYLGTDHLGRDIYSRIVFGARVSAVVGPLAVLLATIVAFGLGAIPGFLGGRTDFVTQRCLDVLISFPPIVVLLSVVQVLTATVHWPHSGLLSVGVPFQRGLYIVATLAAILAFPMARVFRSGALTIRHLQYVEAAKAVGASDGRLIGRHLLPNILPMVITLSTATLGSAILIEAAISYLGVGLPPDIPSWGLMLSEGRNYIAVALNITIWPGLAIGLTVFGFNMLGDAVRDVVDPRLRKG